jgi:CheY-specific phosphatase CheX
MRIRFFGQFLLERGVIRADELLAALEHQERMNLRFGEMAVALELLTERHVDAILSLQRTEDVRAGEAAMRLEYLTEAQVALILRAQKNSHVYLGEALVATGTLTQEQLEAQLVGFAEDQEPFLAASGVPREMDRGGIGRPAVDLALTFLSRLANLKVKLLGCKLGIDGGPRPDTFASSMVFTGDISGEVAVRAPAPICAEIATALVGQSVSPRDRLTIQDALGEFLNVVCGNLSATVARTGKRLELAPPAAAFLPSRVGQEHVLRAALGVPEGEIEFAVLTRH